MARTIIVIARLVAGIAGPILKRFAGIILISVVVGVCVAVWIHALVFGYVDLYILSGTAMPAGFEAQPFGYFSPSTWGLVPSVIGVRIVEAGGWAAGLAGLLKYFLWPVQFGFFRDLLALGGIMGLFNVIPVYTIWWERKVAGRIQSRLGPMRVGGWHGWSQSIADGIKLILKEDLIPKGADALLFRAAPYFALLPVAVAFVALPFGNSYVFRELDVALVFLLGILGIEVIGVIMAGWASNNKWSVYGAMREACQMVSYEIPMGMALMAPVVCVGSLSLGVISDDQSGGWFSWLAFRNPFMFGAFVTYLVASLASAKRAPFDLPEAESELVAGFHTEYSGIRWSFFFFAEYSAMFIIAALAAIMFLGGWHSPLPGAWGEQLAAWVEGFGGAVMARGVQGLLFDGPIWLMFKAVFLLFVHIWIRWTLPRIRIDQVLYACVQVLLPLTMIILLGTTMWVWASTSDSAAWSVFDGVVNVVLGLVGLAFAFGFVGTACYGFYHRRKLVGVLAVDAMPAS